MPVVLKSAIKVSLCTPAVEVAPRPATNEDVSRTHEGLLTCARKRPLLAVDPSKLSCATLLCIPAVVYVLCAVYRPITCTGMHDTAARARARAALLLIPLSI